MDVPLLHREARFASGARNALLGLARALGLESRDRAGAIELCKFDSRDADDTIDFRFIVRWRYGLAGVSPLAFHREQQERWNFGKRGITGAQRIEDRFQLGDIQVPRTCRLLADQSSQVGPDRR